MSAEMVQAVTQLAVLGAVGGVAAWKSWRAESNTRDTGNGFAKEVKDSLGRIEKKVDRTEQKVDDHIDAHADADIHRR